MRWSWTLDGVAVRSTLRRHAEGPDGGVPQESVGWWVTVISLCLYPIHHLPVHLAVKVQVAVEGAESLNPLLINSAFLDVRQQSQMPLPEVTYDRASASAEANSLTNCDRATLSWWAWAIGSFPPRCTNPNGPEVTNMVWRMERRGLLVLGMTRHALAVGALLETRNSVREVDPVVAECHSPAEALHTILCGHPRLCASYALSRSVADDAARTRKVAVMKLD